jgi:O-acetyl-ADP-ribose deacetylase (regulator of RNase III)
MHEITGNLFESEMADAICILTNGFVNTQGANTMGKGCALEAKQRWPGIQMSVGDAIRHGGNDTRVLTVLGSEEWDGFICLPPRLGWPALTVPYHILMFPTKNHWSEPSDLGLIQKSCVQLMELTDQRGWQSVVLPRPGCGAGGLSWENEVRPLISAILDDRIYVITF